MDYRRRVVDQELDELLTELPAISLDGIKGVGKTTTARARASSTWHLDSPEVRELLGADPNRMFGEKNRVSAWGGVLHGVDAVSGESELTLDDYIEQVCVSGLPGAPRSGRWHAIQAFLDGYLARLFDHEVDMVGGGRRQSVRMRHWATAYAAASATTTSYEKLRDAASPGEADKPGRGTAAEYREILSRLWFLDPVEAWLPAGTPLKRLAQAPKHHVADPAFAARLLRLTPDRLRRESDRHAAVIGQLWESLVALSVRVFAQRHMADVYHLRTQGGEHEVDLIVEGPDGQILAIEVKLRAPVDASEVRHLNWLREQLGASRVAAAVITATPHAYTRPDGIHVVPLALLGA